MNTRPRKTLVIQTSKTVLSVMVVLGLVLSPFPHKQAPEVNAFLGVGDIVLDPTNLIQNTVSAVADVDSLVVSKILNGLAWTVAKVAVQSITRSTVNWINSGFKGSPAFVSDLQDNLGYLGDAVAEDFLNNLDQEVQYQTGFSIRSPFQDQVQQKLREEYYRQTSGTFLDPYSLNAVSSDPKAFIDGQFSQGGFNAFFSASQNDANNPFGAYRLASNQLWAKVGAAQQNRREEVVANKGFLSFRGECTDPISLPGSKAGAIVDKNATKVDLQIQNVFDKDGNPTGKTNTSGSSKSVSLTKSDRCYKNSVKTPGSVIEAQLEKSLGSGIDQLNLADSINEIVGALASQLVNKVLGSGGLFGASQPSSGGGRSFIDQATDPSQFANASLQSGFAQTIKDTISSVQKYQDNWDTIRVAAETANNSCQTREVPSIVSDTLTRATNEVTRASGVLNDLESLSVRVLASGSPTAKSDSTTIVSITNDYQAILAGNQLPSATELATATFDSSDTGTSTPSSLYTQVSQAGEACR